MADSIGPGKLRPVPHTEASKARAARSSSTEDAFLSTAEIELLSSRDNRAREQHTAPNRRLLLQTVSRQFNTFHSSAAHATEARPLPTQDSPLSYSLLSTLPSRNPSIRGLHLRHSAYDMPYNNTAIPPPEEVTGSAALPCKHPSCETWTSMSSSLLSSRSGESETHLAIR